MGMSPDRPRCDPQSTRLLRQQAAGSTAAAGWAETWPGRGRDGREFTPEFNVGLRGRCQNVFSPRAFNVGESVRSALCRRRPRPRGWQWDMTNHRRTRILVLECLAVCCCAGALAGCSTGVSPATSASTSTAGPATASGPTAKSVPADPRTGSALPSGATSPVAAPAATTTATATAASSPTVNPSDPRTWVVEPSGVGPFRVGMQASSLVRSGLVAEVPVTECGTLWGSSFVTARRLTSTSWSSPRLR